MEGRVFVVERLGGETYCHVRVDGGQTVVIRTDGDSPVHPGEQVRIGVPPPTATCSTGTASRWTGSSGIRWPIWICPGRDGLSRLRLSEVDRRRRLGYAGFPPEQEPEHRVRPSSPPTEPRANRWGMTGYLAPDGFLDDLVAELGDVAMVHDRLVFAPGPPRPVAWVENIWYDPVRLPVASIKSAARSLRGIQRNWALYPVRHHGRAKLIQEQLPHVSAKPLVFPATAPTAPLGSWMMEDEHTLIASARCSSPFRNGEVEFIENRTAPPNRAYLKLWEALAIAGRHAGTRFRHGRSGVESRRLDLGAS